MTRIDVPNLVKFDFISYVQFIDEPPEQTLGSA
jgi:hypothetical protein